MNIAILIDAENVVPAHADLIFSQAAALGEITRREIYGAASALTSWVAPVLKYAIHPNLTIKAAKGKNSSDIALVIGAMDLLVAGGIDTVVIASSDSDFSALSVRLRNAGLNVVGMGTEKANELWRTACSSFIVLQNPKPAQPAPKQQAAAQAKQSPAPAQTKAQKAARAAAETHEERVAVIRALIEKRLKGHAGRIQVSTLFPALNQLPEYRADKRNAGKKPLNYLTSTFGDAFHFEESSDGQSWVSLPGIALPEIPDAEAAPGADAPAPAEAPEAQPAPQAEAQEAAMAPVEEPAPAESPADEAPVPDAVVDDGTDPLKLLLEAGLPESDAEQIVVIFTESENLRAAYNRLRTTFGSTLGRDYYQKVKEIAGQQ